MSFMMDQMVFLFATFFGGFGIIISILSFSIFNIFEERAEVAEVSFQLHPKKIYYEFLATLFINGVMLIGFIFYAIWGVLAFPLSWNIGMSIGVLYMFTMSIILFRWWRRFK